MEKYSDLILRLSYSITEFVTAYFQTQYKFFIAQISNPRSPANICLGIGILLLILTELGSRIYDYINRK